MCPLWERPLKWTSGRRRWRWARGCFARVTGCNRCYQVEVSGWARVRCLHSARFGRKHEMREIVRDEGGEGANGRERERKRNREQRARVRDRRSRVAVDMKHPSMKQAPSLPPSRSFLSHSLSVSSSFRHPLGVDSSFP